MESEYWSKNGEKFDASTHIVEKADNLFHIGQCYEETVAKTITCKICGGNTFYVGQGSYFTAIKCVKCEWELCIHTG